MWHLLFTLKSWKLQFSGLLWLPSPPTPLCRWSFWRLFSARRRVVAGVERLEGVGGTSVAGKWLCSGELISSSASPKDIVCLWQAVPRNYVLAAHALRCPAPPCPLLWLCPLPNLLWPHLLCLFIWLRLRLHRLRLRCRVFLPPHSCLEFPF